MNLFCKYQKKNYFFTILFLSLFVFNSCAASWGGGGLALARGASAPFFLAHNLQYRIDVSPCY